MTLEELRRFRQLGARTAGHPEHGHAFGIETTTGPLGQGLANAVGMALAERHLAARFGAELVDHHTYVIAGDGCLMEGISHEAASLAGHLEARPADRPVRRQRHLDRRPDLARPSPTTSVARFEAYGWHAAAVDGHDPAAVEQAIAAARAETGRPSLIACRTVIGKGAPTKAGKSSSPRQPAGRGARSKGARAALGWPYPPFEVPDEILAAWRAAGERGPAGHAAWHERHGGRARLRRGAQFDERDRRRAAGRPRRGGRTPTSASCRPSGRRRPPARPARWRSRC